MPTLPPAGRLTLLALLLAPAALAQPVRVPSPPRAEPEPAQGVDGRSFALASTLLDNGRVAEATAMLEDLYAADPSSAAVWLKLEEAYVAGRAFEALIALVEARIERDGPSVELLTRRGTALHRAGRADEAAAAWAAATDLAPDDPQAYRIVAAAVGQLRLFEAAAAVLERGRARLGPEAISPLELAHLYGLALDYERAAELYLETLEAQPDLRAAVQARLTRLLSGEGAAEAIGAAVARASALDPLNRAFRELQAWLALEQGDYDVALDAVRALDRLEAEQGQSLLAFALQAEGAGAPEAAALALDEIRTRHADGPVAQAALLARARLWDAEARAAGERAPGPTPAADSARAAYVRYLEATPNSSAGPGATLDLADLLRDVLRDFEASEARLLEAAATRDAGVRARARFTLGEVALQRGDLDAARQRFADVDETIRIGPLAEQARYELALLDFYEGFMYSALARAEALDENTAADAANDAIALRVTLGDALDPDAMPGPDVDLSDDPLHVYARAALRHRRGLYDEALATLDSLDATAGLAHALADESLYLRATVQLADGAPEASVATLDRLLEAHPQSFFVDRALRSQAETYETKLGDPAAASERYDRLLEHFPGSPLAPEAREVLRRLRAALNS